MNKQSGNKKILIVGNVNHSLVNQLIKNLKKNNDVTVDVFDIFGVYRNVEQYFDRLFMVSLNSNNININFLYRKIKQLYYLNVINNIINNFDNYDVINIHFLKPYHRFIIKKLRAKTSNLIVTIWGSDFYRSTTTQKNQFTRIFNNVDKISFTNKSTAEDFLNYYDKKYSDKIVVCRFGLEPLELIKELLEKEDLTQRLNQFYNKFDIRKKSHIVTCGYNSSPGQQHEAIIERIELLPENIINNTLFLFPIAYGDKSQEIKIKNRLKKVNFHYKILENFLVGKDLALLRIASDVMINIQITDQLSGSMQETLAANNIVITGEWLPYNTFKESGIFLLEVDSVHQLTDYITYALENYSQLKESIKNNKNIINDLSLWDNNIDKWLELYNL